ncbi:MAG: TetR/AcrR family transcriptional regulator [Saprospiraceae bacterium]
MSKTKQKILVASLDLFNTYGMANVSQRRITEQLQISPGNLTYHFKKKEDIETALYFALVEEFDQLFATVLQTNIPIENIVQMMGQIFDIMKKYRFVFLDFAHLLRTHEVVANHYRQLTELRYQQFTFIFDYLIQGGFLRPAELPDEYGQFYLRMQILADFYLVNAEILRQQTADTKSFEQLFFYHIHPYLTKKGRKLLQQYL